MRGHVVCLLLVGLIAEARADKTSEAVQLIDQGIALFNASELTAAREVFERARALVPDRANPYRWLGLVDARLGRCADAVTELDSFIQRVPPTDPRAPEALALRDRCTEELKPKRGSLYVDSTPPGAEVRLDDADKPSLGMTPLRQQSVAAGAHVLFIDRAGYARVTKSFQLERNETVRIDVALQPLPAPPKVAVPPPVAEIVAPVAPPPRRSRRGLAIGLGLGAVVVVGLAVGLGLGLGLHGGASTPVLSPVGP